MNIVNVVQGSEEWHTLRAKRFTASEAPAMLGLSKYKTRTDLLREKSTGLVPAVDGAMQEKFDAGHESEAKARPIVESRLGVELFPVTAILDIDGLSLLASFDGVNMDETVSWENKLKNGSNADLQSAIDNEHWPQLEQQALIAGVERVYFTVSDGTEEGTPGQWYVSSPERRAKLLASWKQFAEDLKNYQHVEDAPAVVGRAPDNLPALRIEVTGMVTASNLTEFKDHALSVIGGIKTDLQTDEDFANAEKTVKWCGEVEDKLEAAKQHALSQTASIDELFRAIDQIKTEARAKRLELNNLVKSRKEAIREEIVTTAKGALASHVAMLNQRLGKPYMPAQDTTRFALSIKGLKTLASLRDAVATELANAKIEANSIADKIEINLNTLRDLAKDYVFLFHDAAQLVLKQNDDLTALVRTRIADHKTEQEDSARRDAMVDTAPQPVAVAPAPAATAATPIYMKATEISIIDAYLKTLNESPKKKAEIKKHIAAFLTWHSARTKAA